MNRPRTLKRLTPPTCISPALPHQQHEQIPCAYTHCSHSAHNAARSCRKICQEREGAPARAEFLLKDTEATRASAWPHPFEARYEARARSCALSVRHARRVLDETCPISMEGGTRRVHLVRGRGQGETDVMRVAPRVDQMKRHLPPHHPRRARGAPRLRPCARAPRRGGLAAVLPHRLCTRIAARLAARGRWPRLLSQRSPAPPRRRLRLRRAARFLPERVERGHERRERPRVCRARTLTLQPISRGRRPLKNNQIL